MNSLSLQTGRSLLLDEQTQYNLRREKLMVRLNGAVPDLEFDFSPLRPDELPLLPNGTIAFIGKNGSGKSTALYKIAALIYSNLNERETLGTRIGTIEPADITVSRLLMFSYSPFDNFLLPGELSRTDLLQWAKKVNDRSGRFIFCGFRDVEREAEFLLNRRKESGESEEKEAAQPNDPFFDCKLHGIPRKPISALAKEAYNAYKEIERNKERNALWSGMLGRLKERHEELYYPVRQLLWAEDEWSDVFARMSTGHKFFIHAMTHAFAYCKPNSLFMFDEPENHLQWPLLGFMMQEMRLLLAQWSSVMLVSTHSPVILQDMLSENIRIVRRTGETVMFQKPRIETYSESFGEISSEVFDMTSDRVFFFDALENIFTHLGCAHCGTAEEAVGKVREYLGDISIQAIHYVVQLWMAARSE